MRNRQEVRDDIINMLMDYVNESETLGYCNNCPELRVEQDTGAYDCPYGLAVDSCEYSPATLFDNDVEKILSSIDTCMP